MPFILMMVIIAITLLGQFIPLEVKQILYALSLSIKSFIVFLLPFVIFGLLFKAATQLSNHTAKIMGLILFCVCCSNFTSTFLSHYVGIWVYQLDLSLIAPQHTNELTAAWQSKWPILITNDKAIFLGILFGMLMVKFKVNTARQIAAIFDVIIIKILAMFLYLVPLFVIGFIIKLQYEGIIHLIIKDYLTIFAIVAFAQFIYIIFAYFLLNVGKVNTFFKNIQHMLPASISGFATMSSAASMPLTIIGVENNTDNKDLARSVIPTTVNIHLVGDCFAIPIFAYAVLKTFGMPQPDLFSYLLFTCYFVLAKFSVAAIPGGGIIVMLPILENYLGFNNNMLSLITALYLLFDPVITCANVFGNGAFAILIDKLTGNRARKHATI